MTSISPLSSDLGVQSTQFRIQNAGMIASKETAGFSRGASLRSFALRDTQSQLEQQRVDTLVGVIQAKFGAIGIKASEGNSPVTAIFNPKFFNAAYTPSGIDSVGAGADSIVIGVDPRSGRSFAQAEDVIAHELAHRVIDHMTKRPLSMSPLSEDVAVHESLADTFAALIDDDDPWTVGEDLSQPIRSMSNPELLGDPGHVRDLSWALGPQGKHMVPVGRDRAGKIVKAPEWHAIAGIPNKAAAILGSKIGKDALGKIYINALRNYVGPGQEIEGLAGAVLQSTKDLYGSRSPELQAAAEAWDAVGVLGLLAKRR